MNGATFMAVPREGDFFQQRDGVVIKDRGHRRPMIEPDIFQRAALLVKYRPYRPCGQHSGLTAERHVRLDGPEMPRGLFIEQHSRRTHIESAPFSIAIQQICRLLLPMTRKAGQAGTFELPRASAVHGGEYILVFRIDAHPPNRIEKEMVDLAGALFTGTF